jgi:uncharacterized membrane protein
VAFGASPERTGQGWRSPRRWLALLVVGFFAVSLYAGYVSYVDFQTQNSTDTGIITQAVASTALGHNPPFFESYDCMVKARCSFLLVHPGVVLYGAVPFYALFPSTLTLFALRSALVALTAVPLYWLTRQVTRSPGKGLLAAGLFLVWAPGFLGDAFSLHLETILPLELLTLAALWQSGRYRWGLLVAAVAFLTLEIAPVFTFLIGVFFVLPYGARELRRWWRDRGASRRNDRDLRTPFAALVARGRAALRIRELRYAFVLMGCSVLAYVALLSFMNVWGAGVLGVASPAVPPGISGVFYDNSTPASASIPTILASSQTVLTAEYWLILYATLAFLPLLSPRALVLSVPWIGWTFLSDSSRFTTLGHQYSMIAAGPLFIGLAYGLDRLPVRPWFSPAPRPAVSAERRSWSLGAGPGSRFGRTRGVSVATAVLLGGVIVGNVLLAPIDPVLSETGVVVGAPFEPGYFDHSLTPSPSFGYAERLVATVPYTSTVTAPSALFPLFANYPHAYVLLGPGSARPQNLPFPATEGPTYVLMDESSFGTGGTVFRGNLSNPVLYGMSGYVGSSSVGPLLLYERGYAQLAVPFGPTPAPSNATYVPGQGLDAGPIGVQVGGSSSTSSVVIESAPDTKRGGTVALSGESFLPVGSYVVRMLVNVTAVYGGATPRTTVLRAYGAGIGPAMINSSYSASQLEGAGWTTLTWNFTLANPLPDFEVEAILPTTDASLAVASVSIGPSPTE